MRVSEAEHSTGECVKLKKVTEIRQCSAHDTFIQQSVYLTSTKFSAHDTFIQQSVYLTSTKFFKVLGASEEIETEFVI